MSESESDVLSLQQAAHKLGIHRSTAYELAKKGPPWGAHGHFPVPVLRVGEQYKVPREQLDHYIRTGELLNGS
jgi:predicted DNA-binding transcriptional regulator AlpA